MKEIIQLPIPGSYTPVTSVPDPVFSAKMLGDGLAITPTEGKVFAPVDGVIESVFPTKHAIAMTSKQGTPILIHVGLESVRMQGQGFTVHVSNGDSVHQGQLLLEFDLDLLKKNADSIISPIVILEHSNVTIVDHKKKDEIIYLTLQIRK